MDFESWQTMKSQMGLQLTSSDVPMMERLKVRFAGRIILGCLNSSAFLPTIRIVHSNLPRFEPLFSFPQQEFAS